MDEKNGGPLSVLHVSKRGIFRFGFQNLGETLLGVLLPRRDLGLSRHESRRIYSSVFRVVSYLLRRRVDHNPRRHRVQHKTISLVWVAARCERQCTWP